MTVTNCPYPSKPPIKNKVFFSSYGTQALKIQLRTFHFLKYPHTFDDQGLSKIMSSTAALHLAALQNSYFASASKRGNVLEQVDICCQDAQMTLRQEETPLTPVKKGAHLLSIPVNSSGSPAPVEGNLHQIHSFNCGDARNERLLIPSTWTLDRCRQHAGFPHHSLPMPQETFATNLLMVRSYPVRKYHIFLYTWPFLSLPWRNSVPLLASCYFSWKRWQPSLPLP